MINPQNHNRNLYKKINILSLYFYSMIIAYAIDLNNIV